MKKNLRASNGLKPKIKKIKPPATNVRKIANTGVKKKIALDGWSLFTILINLLLPLVSQVFQR